MDGPPNYETLLVTGALHVVVARGGVAGGVDGGGIVIEGIVAGDIDRIIRIVPFALIGGARPLVEKTFCPECGKVVAVVNAVVS